MGGAGGRKQAESMSSKVELCTYMNHGSKTAPIESSLAAGQSIKGRRLRSSKTSGHGEEVAMNMKIAGSRIIWGTVAVPIFACRFIRRLATHSTMEAPELSMQFSIVCSVSRVSWA